MARLVKDENKNLPATKNQTFAIFCYGGGDVREQNLTREQASVMIDELKKSEKPKPKSKTKSKSKSRSKSSSTQKKSVVNIIDTQNEDLTISTTTATNTKLIDFVEPNETIKPVQDTPILLISVIVILVVLVIALLV